MARGDVAKEGEGGDDRTYRLAAEIINLGLSEEKALNEISSFWNPHCEPPWPDDELETLVGNAWRYKQNEAGAWGVSEIPDAWGVSENTGRLAGRAA